MRRLLAVDQYLRIPEQRRPEFWNLHKIEHIRALSTTGRSVRPWSIPEERCNRIMDRIHLKKIPNGAGTSEVDTSCWLAYGRLDLTTPLYLGDMSFGALSGTPNIALAKAADRVGVLTGTGEGGLHDEVRKCSRITVQWASARFGVDLGILNSGLAVVIKIGQGAKPGIGGHLPGVKVTEPISRTRRIPRGVDAISPAPHHDIYSIEDLEQRIKALKLATGKPIFVKVGVTNYIPYIATGVARMGADGIIMDGHGAGTGAAPMVVRDNVGIPIELAVSAVDRALKADGLREGFSIIAAGQVSNAEDTAKLIALGADAVSMGTAVLLSMSCVMVHKCHVGFCPAVITNRIDPDYPKILSLEKSTERVVNLLLGWTEELRIIMKDLGIGNVREMVGRKDLLFSDELNQETLRCLGIDGRPFMNGIHGSPLGDPWDGRRIEYLREISGTGEAVTASMGSVAPPFIESPKRISDWIRCDGAQVTRPSIDPYREEVDTALLLLKGLRLSFPLALHIESDAPVWVKKLLVRAAKCHGLLAIAPDLGGIDSLPGYAPRMLTDHGVNDQGYAGYIMPGDELMNSADGTEIKKRPLLAVLASAESSISLAVEMVDRVDGLVIDEDIPCADPLPLEIVISEMDHSLKESGRRYSRCLIAQGRKIRGSDDVFKMIGLGADLVSLSEAALICIRADRHPRQASRLLNMEVARERLENFLLGVKKEVKLLAGAAGVSNLQHTLTGNRELFRTVDLDPAVRRRLYVSPAGLP